MKGILILGLYVLMFILKNENFLILNSYPLIYKNYFYN